MGVSAGRRWFGLGAAIAVLLAACAAPDDEREPLATSPPRITVGELGEWEGSVVTVRGALVAQPGTPPRLCAALAESYPPQCAGEFVAVPGLEVTRVVGTATNDDAPTDRRVVWTDSPIGLSGRVDGRELTLVADPVNGNESAVLVRAEAGPTCPVETDPPEPSCASRPVPEATIELWAPDGRVASTTSDALGVAVFMAGAGDYDVVPLPVAGLLGTPGRQHVIAGPGTVAVLLSYDTGIR